MVSKKIISWLVIVGVLAASVPASAVAGDRHGNGAAIAAGILGAVVIGSLIANSQPAYAAPQPYYQPQPETYYQPQPQTYYPSPPVQQVYYEPPQQYYQPQPVIYVDGRYRERYEYRRYQQRDRDGYYSR